MVSTLDTTNTLEDTDDHLDEEDEIVLVVDDLPQIGNKYSRFLEKGGYQPLFSSDLETALQITKELKPQGIVADVHLTPGTSLPLIKAARRENPYSYILGYSGVQGSSSAMEASELCDDFRMSPIPEEELIRLIKEGIARKIIQAEERLRRGKKGTRKDHPPLGEDPDEGPNEKAYRQEQEKLAKKHEGSYVAYIDGKQIGIYPDIDTLIREVVKETKRTDFFYKKIERIERVTRFRSPRRQK